MRVSILFLSVVFLISCAPLPQSAPPPNVKVAVFEYTPPTQAQVKETDISFVLIRPAFAPTFAHTTSKLFGDFRENLGKDFEELLIARGYTLRGPVDNWYDITYQDKKETDMSMEVEILIDMEPDAGAIKQFYSATYESWLYYLDGQISITGYVNIILKEGFSQEKLYIKKINIEPIQVNAKSYLKYYDSQIPVTDLGVHNVLVPVMEKAYVSLLQKAWEHLNPDEIKPLKEEVKRLRDKRGY